MNRRKQIESIINWLKSCREEVRMGKKLSIDTFNQIIDEVNKLEVTGNGVAESIGSAFTVSDLLHTLIDYVDDGMGYMEVYFNDKPVKEISLRDIYPQMTGTFEPYQELVLSDKERRCNTMINREDNIDWEQRRYEIAKEAVNGLLAAPVIEDIDPNPPMDEIARNAVKIADYLIEELKKEKGGDE